MVPVYKFNIEQELNETFLKLKKSSLSYYLNDMTFFVLCYESTWPGKCLIPRAVTNESL